MEATRKIIVPYGALARLADAVGCSEPTARKALRYEENTSNADEHALANKIRYNAVRNFGGVDSGAADAVVRGDVWTWDYPNGARLAINFKSGFVTITFNGRVTDSADSIPTNSIYDWQLKAGNLK